MGLGRRFIDWNQSQSRRLGAWADRHWQRPSSMGEFQHVIVPNMLAPGSRVLDVGGGKRPLIPLATKQQLNLDVVGLDIDADELAAAPSGAYDATIQGDVAEVALPGKFDLIVSQTVLEHVRDTRRAIANLAAALAPGGQMAHMLPCGNAPFALVNRLLGPWLSQRLLWTLYPETRNVGGFPAYYRHCTPRSLARLVENAGLDVQEIRAYYSSEYGRFFLPLYAVELARQLLMQRLGWANLCETMILVAAKPPAEAQRAAA